VHVPEGGGAYRTSQLVTAVFFNNQLK
jgi:hypothetical protein